MSAKKKVKTLLIIMTPPEYYDNMEYVKLTAKPNTWFDEGTEVFMTYYNDYNKVCRRIDEFVFVGLRGEYIWLGKRNGNWDEKSYAVEDFNHEFVKEEYAE